MLQEEVVEEIKTRFVFNPLNAKLNPIWHY